MEKNELVKTLELMLDDMSKKGLIHGLNQTSKEQLAQTVAQNILSVQPDIKREELLDPKFQKTLGISLISQRLMDTDKSLAPLLDYKKLFQFNKHDLYDEKSKNEAQKELKNVFKMLLLKLNELTPASQRKSDKELDALAGLMAKKALNTYMQHADQPTMRQSNTMTSMMLEPLLELSSRQLLGGVSLNPNASAITYPVQNVVGNLFGIVDQVGGNQNSAAFLDAVNRYDAKDDPLGIEEQHKSLLGNMGLFIDQLTTTLGVQDTAQEAKEAKEASATFNPSPFNMRNTPPTGKSGG